MPENTTELLDALTSESFRVVKEGKTCYAMLSLHPLAHGHTMILPKRNVHKLADLTAEESKELLTLANDVVEAVQKLTNKDCALIQNYGKHSSIAHIHLHVIPTDYNTRHLYTAKHHVPLKEEADKETLTQMCNDVKQYLA